MSDEAQSDPSPTGGDDPSMAGGAADSSPAGGADSSPAAEIKAAADPSMGIKVALDDMKNARCRATLDDILNDSSKGGSDPSAAAPYGYEQHLADLQATHASITGGVTTPTNPNPLQNPFQTAPSTLNLQPSKNKPL